MAHLAPKQTLHSDDDPGRRAPDAGAGRRPGSRGSRAVKSVITAELRQRVLDLHHRHHTQRETAALTGLPLGTVQSWCSRSGAFRDNARHRALFTLPPLRSSGETLPAVPEVPQPTAVTGDPELDAVLWLRSVIQTGQATLIDKAMAAAKRIVTPAKALERRYMEFLAGQNPGNDLAVVFGSLGFADLEGLARQAIDRERLRSEAAARFGEALFEDTEAEIFCVETLASLRPVGAFGEYDEEEAAAAFRSRPELVPHTLTDCLAELEYWRTLYRLRQAVAQDDYDSLVETQARARFVFGLLAQRRARTKAEAVAVFRYLRAEDRMNDTKTEVILLHLLGDSPGR